MEGIVERSVIGIKNERPVIVFSENREVDNVDRSVDSIAEALLIIVQKGSLDYPTYTSYDKEGNVVVSRTPFTPGSKGLIGADIEMELRNGCSKNGNNVLVLSGGVSFKASEGVTREVFKIIENR